MAQAVVIHLRRLSGLLLALLLAACAVQPARVTSLPKPDWAFQQSDLPPDPAFRFGKLPNGMRYIIRHNATPPGTAAVRLDVDAGSLDEAPNERGFAHFVEHMAFNGSTHVPEGEMVRLLERKGLAFGADTNAQTGFEQTLYQLDLPRADPALLDTALMLLRETASELTFDPAAVARERGVVLSELRDGRGYALDNLQDQLAFFYPKARYPQRLPIGTVETLNAATGPALRAFWAREYVPAKATLIVVGDFDAAAAETSITAHFASWQPAPPPPHPNPGRVLPKQKGKTDVWIAPALSERVTISRHGPWLDEPDTIAARRTNLLREIGYGVVNRRLLRIARQANPPFRGAGLGTSDVFRMGRTTNLVIDTPDGGWARGLATAGAVYAQAMAHGFTDAEVAEQVANIRAGIENAAASADTRSNAALVSAALSLIRDDIVPTTPQGALARFNGFAPAITPEAVLAAMRTEAVPLTDPLIRFQGRSPPAGGARALRKAWNATVTAQTGPAPAKAADSFAYTDFGPAGAVVADSTEPALGIRTLRFANGVRLNLKRTALEADRVQVRVSIDGGELLETRDDPLAVDMVSLLPAGGLGKHSQDDLQSLLAGRSVTSTISANGDRFTSQASTTRRDLDLQLQLLAALVSDPGYRPEAEVRYQQAMTNFFARYRASPASALANEEPAILSDNDPRFTLQPPAAYQQLTFARLKSAIADRLAHGAIEIGVVGDIDEAATIAAVARTFGALPPREPAFRDYTAERTRRFTAARGLHVVRHTGDASQAVVKVVWPTTDDADPETVLTLELLQEVAGIEVLDTVREALGKSYSPGASSNLSHVWRGWGTFAISAAVDVRDVAATRTAIADTVRSLRDQPLDPDVLARARAPMLDRLENALKNNAGWLGLVAVAQSQPDRIDRFLRAKARLQAMTATNVQAAARRWLTPVSAVAIVTLPEGTPAPLR